MYLFETKNVNFCNIFLLWLFRVISDDLYKNHIIKAAISPLSMENSVRKNLYELEEKLNKINYDYDNPIDMCNKSIETVVSHLKQLKAFVLENHFKSQEEEIYFFKKIKPKFTSKLIYFKKIKKLESRKPLGSKKLQRDYLDNELNKLNIFFSENLEFYNYYRSGSQFIDNKIFVRDNTEIDNNLELFYYELDHNFTTTHDFKVAAIIANEIVQKYIDNKIDKLSDNKNIETNPLIETMSLKWTGTKSELIEIIYALHFAGVINFGKAEIAEIARCFENMFNIDLGKFYRTKTSIKDRKKNIPIFLDRLKKILIEKLGQHE